MNGRITEAPAYLRGECAYVLRCDCPRHQGAPIVGGDTTTEVEWYQGFLRHCGEVPLLLSTLTEAAPD